MRLRHEKSDYVRAVKMTEKNNEENASFLRLYFSVIPNTIASLSLSLSLSFSLTLLPAVFPHKNQSISCLSHRWPVSIRSCCSSLSPRVSENAVSKENRRIFRISIGSRRKRHSDIATSARRSLCHHRLSVTFAFWHGVVAKINRQLLTRSSHSSSVARGPLADRRGFRLARCSDVVQAGAKANSDSRHLFLETELRARRITHILSACAP